MEGRETPLGCREILLPMETIAGEDLNERKLVRLMESCAYDFPRFMMVAYPWGEPPLDKAPNNKPDDWQLRIAKDLSDALSTDRDKDGRAIIRSAITSGHGTG